MEKQKPKTPKTWSELLDSDYNEWSTPLREFCMSTKPIEKSTLALLKIHQLIEVGYGGNVTKEHINKLYLYMIVYDHDSDKFIIMSSAWVQYSNVLFHTKEQAEEFLSYPENIKLLKDYFII